MQHDIRPGWLLRQARELAVKPGPGRPRTADLRRAVSAAYYAVFHSLSRRISESATPEDAGKLVRYELCRVWQHGELNQVCGWVAGFTKPANKWLRGLVSVAQTSQSLVLVATRFQNLMADRHAADYDHMAEFVRDESVAFVTMAEDTVNLIGDIPGTDPGWQAFVNLVLLRAKVA